MRNSILLLISLCLTVSAPAAGGIAASRAEDAPVRRCKGERLIKYKVDVGERTLGKPVSLILLVAVKPDQINREALTLLARQLKSDFCHEPRVYASIYDDPRAVKEWHWATYHAMKEGKVPMGPLRGTYLFDRNTGEERLTFSLKRENPIDEVSIVLGEPKQR